jgi:hypothetical protein
LPKTLSLRSSLSLRDHLDTHTNRQAKL